MEKPRLSEYEREVAEMYDQKQDDFNLLLGNETDLIHHHFGVGYVDPATFGSMSQDEIHDRLHFLESAQVDRLGGLMAPLSPDDVVFDGGSGRAGTAIKVHEQFGCEYHGVNISPYQLEFSRRLVKGRGYGGKVRFHYANMMETGFDEDTFDCLVTNETTMYARDLDRLYREFARIAKPNGKYVMATWCVDESHPNPRKFTDFIDRHYKAVMHLRKEYFEALVGNHFIPEHVVELSDLVRPSFELRLHSEHLTGVEPSFVEGFKEGAIHYFMARFRYLPHGR